MVRKIFGFLYKETPSLNQAAFLLGSFSLLSQLLAFVRDRLLAHIFGASETLDIYYAAFRIPDLIFVTVASVVSLSVLVPFILEEDARGREFLRRFIDNIFSFFSVLIIGVALLAFFLMPLIASLLFKGFSPYALEQTIFISRILLFSPVILGFSNLFGSLTQAYERFTVYALTPVLYNAGIILGIIFLAEKVGVMGVAIGVIIGASLHMLIQVPFVFALGLFPRPTLNFDTRSIIRVISISLPRTLTLSMSQISMLFLFALASLMPVGSISVLSFSNNLQSVPLSLIGVSYSLAAFPTLSKRFRENNLDAFKRQMASTTRFIIFWSLPLASLFIVLRAQIVRVVLGSGQFSWNDTRLTAAALALFTISSVFQSLLLLFMRGFYSAGFTKKPFFINLISTVILFALAWSSVKIFYSSEFMQSFIGSLLRVSDLADISVLVLPLAFSVATVVNGLILWLAFEREFSGFSRGILKTFVDCLAAALVMGVVAYISLNLFALIFNIQTLIGIFAQGLVSGIIASLSGVLTLISLDNKEIKEVWSAIHERFWKTKVIATDPEIV